MTACRRLALVVAALGVTLAVVSAALAAAFATLPVAIALATIVLALVVGLRKYSKITWWQWRPRAAGRSARAGPWAAAAAPPTLDGLSWTTAWDTMPLPSAMPLVRERVAAVLTGWGLPGEAAEPSLLALTELVTNAIEHATAPLRVTLGLGPEFVRVEVHDAAPEPPWSHRPAHGRGHGLEIVAGLALRHGWSPDPHGKVVWADVGIGWPE